MNDDLAGMTGAELVDVFNGLGPDKPLKAPYKGSKTSLIEKIEALKASRTDDADNAEPSVTEAPEEPDTEAVVEVTSEEPTKTKRVRGDRTIKVACLELLSAVSHYVSKEDRDQRFDEKPEGVAVYSVGLTYPEILEKVREEFPDAKTSSECLRWYAVKMRGEDPDFAGYFLPQIRPRAKSAKKDG